MITQQLQTVLKDSVDHKLQLKQKCKQKVSELKEARVCTEWKKARSRVAARIRREKESQLFREIATLLPLAPNMEAQLDKASVIRLTIAYLHLRAILDTPDPFIEPAITQPASAGPGEPEAEVNRNGFLNDALGRFLLIVSLNGKVIYTSKDVTFHTGINQMELIGRSLFDFMHPCDQKELKEILTKLIGCQEQQKCEVFLRMKGANNNKLTHWKVIHCTGVKKSSYTPGCSCLLLLCRSLPVQDIEIGAHLNFKTFLSIHSPDMKFTYCHSGVQEMTGFNDIELYGQSAYQYYHPSDCQNIREAHLSLFVKGQVYTGKYRLLQKHGGYVWVETEATVVYNIRTGKPESVVCVNYILSGVEMADMVFSLEQTGRLLKPCDPLQSEVQPIRTLFTTTPQSASTTSDKHRQSMLTDGSANGQSVIKQISTDCNSLTCDICQLDLDSLAPYIPMDEEDFQLTPTLDAVVNSDLKRYSSRPCSTLDLEQHSHLEPVLPTTTVISPALQHTDTSFSLTDRISKGAHATLVSSRQRHDILHTVNRNQVEHRRQIPSFYKANHWTGRVNVSQNVTEAFRKHSDGLQSYSPPGSVPWDPVFTNPLRYPDIKPHHTAQTRVVKMLPAPTGLPVLSRWECEVNAPLGAPSQLLQGNELAIVLDQVTPAAPWY